jgi:hypothetical protein
MPRRREISVTCICGVSVTQRHMPRHLVESGTLRDFIEARNAQQHQPQYPVEQYQYPVQQYQEQPQYPVEQYQYPVEQYQYPVYQPQYPVQQNVAVADLLGEDAVYNNTPLNRLRVRDAQLNRTYNQYQVLRELNRYNLLGSSGTGTMYDVFSRTDGTNIPEYFEDIKSTVQYLINEYRQHYHSIKFSISVYVEYYRQNENRSIDEGHQSKKIVLHSNNQFDTSYNNIV